MKKYHVVKIIADTVLLKDNFDEKYLKDRLVTFGHISEDMNLDDLNVEIDHDDNTAVIRDKENNPLYLITLDEGDRKNDKNSRRRTTHSKNSSG